MLEALAEAKLAFESDEVPVGAVVVRNDKIIARAHNLVERRNDASAHAELLALKGAAEAAGNRRLTDCVLYVTMEPCAMCAGALLNFRIGALAFGAFDPAAGCCMSKHMLLNGSIPFVGGILQKECALLLGDYFSAKRRDAGNAAERKHKEAAGTDKAADGCRRG